MLPFKWEETIDPKDPLFTWRKKAWERFEILGWPQPKQEAFQYVPLAKATFLPLAEKGEFHGPLPEGQRIVFVDGFFDEKLSNIGKSLHTAFRSYGLFLQNRNTTLLKDETDPFAALNSAFQSAGAFLYLPPRTELSLAIYHICTQERTVSPRLFVYLGRGAKVDIVQQMHSSVERFTSNGLFDLVLDEGAQATLTDQSEVPAAAVRLQALRATIKRDGRFTFQMSSKGSDLDRLSAKIQLAEENSEVHLGGLSRLTQTRQSHINTSVEHMAPHTRSRQHFKTVLEDSSRASFQGKILVRPIAQKTEAYQLSQNLLLSDSATAYAKPNLEIFADDVKASHGATVGQLDAEQLFYLQSRGIPLAEAKKWLIESFCK